MFFIITLQMYVYFLYYTNFCKKKCASEVVEIFVGIKTHRTRKCALLYILTHTAFCSICLYISTSELPTNQIFVGFGFQC